MHIVICDDLEQDAQETKYFLETYFTQHQSELPQIDIVHTSSELWRQKQIDLLFLDIELAGELGIAVAEKVNRQYPDTLIIFVSSYPFYVTDTYKVEAVQFLVKPLQNDVFIQVMEQVLCRYKAKNAYYIRRCEGEPMAILKSQVVYIVAQKRILTAHLANEIIRRYYGTLAEEEQELTGNAFVRCHKSYLVNMNYVQHMDRKGMVVKFMNNQTKTIPIGESVYHAVNTAYLKYIALSMS